MAETKRWYYVTLTDAKVWNLTVEAISEDEAIKLAELEHVTKEPDYTNCSVEAEEVKKYVE